MNQFFENDPQLSEPVVIQFIRTSLSTIQALTDGCVDYVQMASGPAGDFVETAYDVVQDEIKKEPQKLLLGAFLVGIIGGVLTRKI